jgi:hypothetical protein
LRVGFREHHAADKCGGKRVIAAAGCRRGNYKSCGCATHGGKSVRQCISSIFRQARKTVEARRIPGPIKQCGSVGPAIRKPKNIDQGCPPGGFQVEDACGCRAVAVGRGTLQK